MRLDVAEDSKAYISFGILFAFLLMGGVAHSQIPDEFTNLKVLPRGIEKRDLVNTMKNFTFSLGVRCSFCHVGKEEADLSTYDFASDDK